MFEYCFMASFLIQENFPVITFQLMFHSNILEGLSSTHPQKERLVCLKGVCEYTKATGASPVPLSTWHGD